MKDEQTRLAVEALKAAGCGVLAIHVQSRIEALEKDAARYRWLREGGDEQDEVFGYFTKDALDREIDTAMQSEKEGV